MSNLHRLPVELLEQIYYRLGSIDDIHHLARACKRTYDVIRLPSIYVKLMRSIIGSAPQHRYDVFLCEILRVHRCIVNHFAGHHDYLPAALSNQLAPGSFEAQLLTIATSKCSSGPCTECLPDDRVYEILARYQGLRVLENEWLLRPLNTSDLIVVEYDTSADQFVQMHSLLLKRHEEFKDGVAPAHGRESPEIQTYTSFNADQRNRFYAALTSIWILNEVRWVLAQFTYQGNTSIQLRILDVCKTSLEREIGASLVDEADRYAMWQFLYQHILPLYGSFLADQDCSQLPLTFPSKLDEQSPHKVRMLQLFFLAGQTHLQPPDLIDLILRYRTSRKRPFPELNIPHSTKCYQRPSGALSFQPGPYSAGLVSHRERNAMRYLNLISRATINQSEARPFTRWVRPPAQTPDPYRLFNARDESAVYFHDMIMRKFKTGRKQDRPAREQLAVIMMNEKEQLGKVWWEVWWWANSEDKARAKIDRWANKKDV